MRLSLMMILTATLLVGCVSHHTPTASAQTEEVAVGAVAGLPEQPVASASSAFWEAWGDGRAELSSYRVTEPRYGENRTAELVLIYVTEPMHRQTWIKDDNAQGTDRVNVLKLNYSLKFLTGIYPYSVMGSVFAPVDDWGRARFSPVKLGLSVQEWCGMYTHLVWPGTDRFRETRLSYFADEGEQTGEVDLGGGALYEDALLIQLRELEGPFAGGGEWEGLVVPTMLSRRYVHTPLQPFRARITRSTVTEAGQPLTRFDLTYEGNTDRSGTAYVRSFYVEQAAPRRIVRWTTTWGEEATLVQTERLPYWQLNGEGDERYRAPLGLDTDGYVVGSSAPNGQ
jgi:hypothetical protein